MDALNTLQLVHKTKQELFTLLNETTASLADPFMPEDEDYEYQALENIEQIVYTLRNCDYEGRQ